MTPIQVRLAAAYKKAAASSAWYAVDDIFDTLMWRSAPRTTPAEGAHYWDQPTYTRLVFVSVAKNDRAWTVVVRKSGTPWTPMREQRVSLTHAISVLENPEELWT
jgi:hypothetical protein